MNDREILEAAESYLDDNWETMVSDIESLVEVKSVSNPLLRREGAPFGPDAREALDRGLAMAVRLGLETDDLDGFMGIADLPGESDRQLAIIGHLDVVDAGPGWNFEPFGLTRKDGYLIGRGTADDKAPTAIALHAARFWKEQGERLPYTLRVLLGVDEERGMEDVAYYRERFSDPAFLLTPDAEFPVCYGEKGIARFKVKSARMESPAIYYIEAGTAVNAVPGFAFVKCLADIDSLEPAYNIGYTKDGCCANTRIEAYGTSAHASTPELGDNAIGRLLQYLISSKVVREEEQRFFELLLLGILYTDGRGYGIACEDDDFGPLTISCGKLEIEPDRTFSASFDVRYPTTITTEKILATLQRGFAHIGATVEMTMDFKPFLMGRDSKAVEALLSAYNTATGDNAEPFTTGGGTYARKFERAASFGPLPLEPNQPDWVGSMHGPDEGIAEETLKQQFRVYVLAIAKLMKLDL